MAGRPPQTLASSARKLSPPSPRRWSRPRAPRAPCLPTWSARACVMRPGPCLRAIRCRSRPTKRSRAVSRSTGLAFSAGSSAASRSRNPPGAAPRPAASSGALTTLNCVRCPRRIINSHRLPNPPLPRCRPCPRRKTPSPANARQAALEKSLRWLRSFLPHRPPGSRGPRHAARSTRRRRVTQPARCHQIYRPPKSGLFPPRHLPRTVAT